MARLLEVRGLSVGIKKNDKYLKAVNDVSFTIDEGEILGIAGESGCGKTLTALSIPNLISERKKILAGEIIFDNRNLLSLTKKQMRAVRAGEISMIFQEIRESLNPLLKAGVQIAEKLEIKGNGSKAQNRAKVLEILEDLGFLEPEKIYSAYPHQLSGGMCQRIMTAIAAIGRPRLLIADEPSSALDSDSEEKILSLLSKMNREFKMSVLIISHDLSIIRRFCSRYLVMYAGRIVEEGASSNFSFALHPYTNALVNAIPAKEKRGGKLKNIPGKVPSIEDDLTGCPFAPRCKRAQNRCHDTFPPLAEINGQRVYCYFPHTGETHE